LHDALSYGAGEIAEISPDEAAFSFFIFLEAGKTKQVGGRRKKKLNGT
jgi:hypothetical protein